MVALRKAQAGSDSFGHIWSKPGAVVEVTPEQAQILLGIPDGGFSVASEVNSSESFSEITPIESFSEVIGDEPEETKDKKDTGKHSSRNRRSPAKSVESEKQDITE